MTTIDVAGSGILLAAEILQAGPLSGSGAVPTRLSMATVAHYAGQTVHRERATYRSDNAAHWGEFRCLGTVLALGEPFNATLADELSRLWQRHCLWGAFSPLAGGISGKLLTQHPQDCRDAVRSALHRLRRATGVAGAELATPTETPLFSPARSAPPDH